MHVAAAFGVATSGVIPTYLAGAMFVEMGAELSFGAQGLGFALTAFFIMSALASPLLGGVVQARGPRAGVALTTLLVMASMLLVAFVVNSWWGFLIALLIGGCGNSFAQPTANVLLVRGVGSGNHGLAFGLKQSSVPAAGMLAGLFVPIVAMTLGWRWTFGLAALFPIVVLLLGRRLDLENEPDPAGIATVTAPGPEPSQVDTQPPSSQASDGTIDDAEQARLKRRLRLIATGTGLGAFVGNGGVAFLVPAAVALGISHAGAGTLLAAVSLVGLIARVGSGIFADRSGVRPLTLTIGLKCAGVAGFALAALAGRPGLIAGGFLAFAIGWAWTGLVHWEISSVNASRAASATGTLQLGIYGGAAMGPTLFALIMTRWSYSAGWLFCAVLVVISIMFMARGRAT